MYLIIYGECYGEFTNCNDDGEKMTEQRFIVDDDEYIRDNTNFSTYLEMEDICDLLNDLDNELMNCRARNTNLKLILKDIVNDLKRYDSRRMAEHIEKIANLKFMGEE